MVEMQVYGMAVDEESEAPVLVLKNEERNVVLPIWIGAMEAMAISLVLNEVSFPRPMTHDLLLDAVSIMGGEIIAVEIVNIDKGTFYAELVIKDGEETRRLDARPSDAVAVALRAGAPVFVAEKVLDVAGTSENLKSVKNENWDDELDNLSPDDCKYKM